MRFIEKLFVKHTELDPVIVDISKSSIYPYKEIKKTYDIVKNYSHTKIILVYARALGATPLEIIKRVNEHS